MNFRKFNGKESKCEQMLNFIREGGKPVCCHDISRYLNVTEANASGQLTRLVKSGLLVKTLESGNCPYSSVKHTFYNYSGKNEMLERRDKNVISMLNKEIETLKSKKTAGNYDLKLEIYELKKQLETERMRLKILACVLSDILKER